MPGEKNTELATAILSCIGDGIISTDLNGRIMYINRIAEDITGWDAGEALGREIEQVFSIYNAVTGEAAENPIHEVIHMDSARGLMRDTVLRTRDHKQKYVSATCSPVKNRSGITIGVVLVIRDITRLRTLEIRHKEAKEAAEAANRAKSEFLANMSHEIRTPINGMMGMVDLTLLTHLTEEQEDYLLTAKACASSLLNIINDILDFSKLEAGKISIRLENFNLKDLVEEIIKTHSPKITEKGLELFYTFFAGIPQYLVGDPHRLRQVLNNLINNAMKFTEQGNITLTIKKVIKTGSEIELEFTVSDTGIGIASDKMDQLFKSFSQIDGSYTRKFAGTGLGLVISKRFIEKMGGKIWVESAEGEGSAFHFTLRFQIGKTMVRKECPLPKMIKTENPLNIMVVEDDAVNLKVICKMLKEKGHTVDAANSGEEALALYKRGKYDAVLMDIQMSDMDGVQTSRRIREMEGDKTHTPIIAITAYAMQGDREKFIHLGLDGYIPKPIQMESVFGILEEIASGGTAGEGSHSVEERDVDSGTVYFTGKTSSLSDSVFCLEKQTGSAVPTSGIMQSMSRLESAIESGDLLSVEDCAHEIKMFATVKGAEKIKNHAFKIELAARRANIEDALINMKKMKSILIQYERYETKQGG